MALAYPKLNLPDVEETIAFRAVETILSTDPLLKSVTKAFHSWSGDPGDILDPTFATCPYLRISPAAQGSAWVTEIQHGMPMTINITAAVAGSDRSQLMNYWGCVRRAIWPKDATRFASVQNIGQQAAITKPILTLNGYGVMVTEQGLRMLVAQGTLKLVLLVRTP